MKNKDKKDLFTKSEIELSKLLKDARDNLFNLRLDLSQNKLKNTKSVFLKRKEISLILTALREKELENARSTDVRGKKE
ncbi:MAG: 50S ribosomal protein L29 [Candidatus Levybacteria bacterium RIFCSPHIGHO2_01_FULL_37_17]|nr:MAG: 50S ribosomal protein L29 [Candidatus Levybacteria bacterium RIFCSPHIGHO2_01_FULL_37_17]OGH37075.1 MAG: 50S ribosomal protein L29 [Candidatus Levybacteria bacterium RIFCSPLOWO2_01_FULL_38_23]